VEDFRGRVAVVTGGASGIGRAAAEGLARAGAHVVLSDLNGEGVQQAARELGGHTLGLRTDVTDERAVVELFRETVLAFGGLDTVVLSAGVAFGLFMRSPAKMFRCAAWPEAVAEGMKPGCTPPAGALRPPDCLPRFRISLAAITRSRAVSAGTAFAWMTRLISSKSQASRPCFPEM